ncbi:MAG: hypothetical protein GY751_19360 [Bacteroidetes bacterium]|nr:hypothetical protein [Bacteroidota bacterium]
MLYLSRIILILLICLTAGNASAQVVINEFLSSNTWTNVDTRDYWGYSDWIELHNQGAAAVDLTGYHITDDPANPTKWTFAEGAEMEAGEYLIIWADGRDKHPGDRDTVYLNIQINLLIRDHHLNFKLSSQGETLVLTDTSGQIADSISFGRQLGDVSFGRRADDPLQWAWFGSPTPGGTNGSIPAESVSFTGLVVHSPEGGQFIGSQLISLSAGPGETIRYTTNGAVPNESSDLYTSPILVTSPTVVKARTFKADAITGPVSSHSYLINTTSTLPSISVSTNPQDLWNIGYGIYVNSYKDREIPVNVEYIDANGVRQFEVGAGAELFGSNIFFLGQKPISLTMKNKYGDDKLQYPLFEERGQVLYDDFVLRNGGNDNGLTFFRDALVMSILKGEMDLEYQAFQPCAVYLNGNYWGLYNLRERLNEDYLLYTDDVSPLNVDILEDNSDVRTGTEDAWQSYIGFIENNSLAESANYEYAVSQIDLDSYMDYKILKIFIGYWIDDVNLKYWRGQSGGKWRWMAFDLEHAFGQLTSDTCEANTLQTVSSTGGDLPEWSTLMFRKFLENDDFKETFVNRFISRLNTTFENDRLIAIIDELTALYQPEMGKHINRWVSDPLAIPDLVTWLTNIRELKDYVLCRPDEVYEDLMELLEADTTHQLSVHIPGSDTALVLVNGVAVYPPLFEAEYPEGSKTEIVVIPFPGFDLAGWNGSFSGDTIQLVLGRDSVFVPSFDSVFASTLRDTIREDLLLEASGNPYYVTDDIIVDSFVTLDIRQGVEIRFADNACIMVHGNLIAWGDSLNPVVFMSDPHPSARRPYNNSNPKWGAVTANNSQGAMRLVHVKLIGSSYGRNRYQEKASINSFNSNTILEYVDIPSSVQPVYAEGGTIGIAYSRLRTNLTGDLINIKYASDASVSFCDLMGNDAEDMDAIDFDGLENGLIYKNKIYNFLGNNSDGIDLGESAKYIVISSNEIYNCSDKGISVGQQSEVEISQNVIANCAQGVGIKDEGSFASIDHNTFYSNDLGVAIFEKNAGEGGGSAEITNTIISKSLTSPVYKDALSNVEVNFSLAESPLPEGEGNLQDDPLFVNAGIFNFELRANSPCIDTGDPNFESDPDGSRTDMGAYFTYSGTTEESYITINEINYNSGDCEIEDWVELYNTNNGPVDLSGWKFMDDQNQYDIPEGTMIAGESYLILCRDLASFNNQFAGVTAIGNFNFGLSNGGEQLVLVDDLDNIVSSFLYDDRHPWPQGADGYCNTLEIFRPENDHAVGAYWHTSYSNYGTPGAANSEIPEIQALYINEFMASNITTIEDDFNEFDDWVEIFNGGSTVNDVGGLYITDNLGNLLKWRIPRTNTEISEVNANGFNLLWADGQPDQGTMHLDFGLSLTGEALALVQVTATDTIILDSISFGPQATDTTFGQYSDGMDNWQVMVPTPLAQNMLLVPVIEEVLNSRIKVYPNPADDFVHLEIEELSEYPHRISLKDLSGRQIKEFPGHHARLDVRDLPSSNYILIMEFSNFSLVRKLLVH